jgi:two-component system chemotaxis sensor kinase CheA
LTNDLQQKLLATFEIEHRDHVEHIRSLLALVERAGTAAGPELEEVFRRAHSLKGAARAVDLCTIERLAHRLETLFSQVRQGARPLNPPLVAVVQQVLDASEDCMAGLAENRQPRSVATALEAIETVLGIEAEVPDSPREPRPALPAFERRETVRISARNFDGLFRSAAGLVAECQRQHRVTEKLGDLVAAVAQLEKEGEQARRSVVAASGQGGKPVNATQLADAMHSLECRVRLISRQTRAVYHQHRRGAWALRQLGRQLQQDAGQARLVPAESLLEGYRKVMRDLARDEGKEIRFDGAAAGVHADRRVLEALKDPILHLLRNAVSHGVEAPLARRRKGKPPSGEVSLRIDARGQRLIVTVEDDGRGVDFARVAEIAARDGLAASSLAVEELQALLFSPGFSTAAAVTQLAGRGMGLSVVRETVRRLRGDLDLRPSVSGGTRIVLSVPLSVASQRLLLVTCGGEPFAIPFSGIEGVHRIDPKTVATAGGRPLLSLGGESIPLAGLDSLLGLPVTPQPGVRPAVVVRSGGRRGAVLVDAVVRETEAPIQDLGPAGSERVSAGAVFDDGSIALVLNPAEMVDWVHCDEARPAPAAKAEAAPVASPRDASPILVVDDSLTTRTLQRSILEAHGYRVRLAVDGVEALARLREERPGLVIADIEMPRLDGFGLLEAIKRDNSLETIPVIIVTSLERREDRERGLAMGADAYIVKQKFDQEELLAVVRQIL